MPGFRRGTEGRTPHPCKNYNAIGFLSNTGPDPLKNHKATKPVFNVGPSQARHRNVILMAFRWRPDYVIWILSYQLKREREKTLSDKTIWIRVC